MQNQNMLQINQELLESVNRISPFCVVVFNKEGIKYFDHDCETCQVLLNDIINRNFDNFVDQLSQEFIAVEYHLNGVEGMDKWFQLHSKLVSYQGVESVFSYVLDITDRKRASIENIRLSKIRSLMLEVTHSVVNNDEIEIFYSLILKNALAAIEKSHLGSIFIRRENYFQCISYIGFDESLMDFQLPVQHSFLYRATDGAMDRITYLDHIKPSDLNYPIKIDTGEYVFIKSSLSAPIVISGEVYGMINIDSLQSNAFDETDVKSMEFIRDNIEIAIINHKLFQEKSHLAKYDRLTGLYNRHYFEDQYEFIKQKAQRYKETVNLVMFDVDNLKKTNDKYGHFVGDQVIRKIALEMQTNCRKSDVVARFGGDEMIAVLFASDEDELQKKYSNIQERLLENPVEFFDEQIYCSFSFGIASFPKEGQDLEDLLKIADSRMYINKSKRAK
ncbi:MAG: sensor domain-containing diguanylate cyclase [Erysipelotrichaceae bacterium]|nr:sensor domain-containing diguanylate cyclase [Erysipelotrichaceae bacterium]